MRRTPILALLAIAAGLLQAQLAPSPVTASAAPVITEGTLTRVTPMLPTQHDGAPVWTSNDTLAHGRLNFQWFPEQDMGDFIQPGYWALVQSRIHVVNRDGGSDVMTAHAGSPLAFLEPQQTLAFRDRSTGHFSVAQLDGGGAQFSGVRFIEFSPSGQKMLWADGQGIARVSNLDGSEPVVLPTWLQGPMSFSPDGSQIAVGGRSVYVLNVDGTGLRMIADDNEIVHNIPQVRGDTIAWSPDGSDIWIAGRDGLIALDPNGTPGFEDCDDSTCFIVPPTGRLPQVTSTDNLEFTVWSPDKTRLLVWRYLDDAAHQLALADADGSGLRVIASFDGTIGLPSWSPDSRSIAFSHYSGDVPEGSQGFEGGSSSVYVLDLEGGPAPDPDADDDGVDDGIDTGVGTFDDGAGTSGSITDTAGHAVFVAPDPNGVRITVAGSGAVKAVFTVCGFTLRLAPDSEVVVSCGSITTAVIAGQAELVLGGGLTIVSIPVGVTARVDENPDGGLVIEHLAGSASIGLVVDGVAGSVPPGGSLEPYAFRGFLKPIANAPKVNRAPAGVPVPVRFSLDGNKGLAVLATGSPTVQPMNCKTFASTGAASPAAGQLVYVAILRQYVYVWETQRAWGDNDATRCKQLSVRLDDGSIHLANFRFSR